MKILKTQRGQALIEYLVLVAMMAVAAIGIVRALNQTVNAQFATITNRLQGKDVKARLNNVSESLYKKKDLGDFFEGSTFGGPDEN